MRSDNSVKNSGSSFEISNRGKAKDRGASMVEYALLVALIAIVALVAVRVLGQKVSQNFSRVASNV